MYQAADCEPKQIFRKLNWPLDRRGLKIESGLLLLAYDIIWRLEQEIDWSNNHAEKKHLENLKSDVTVNLASIGKYLSMTQGDKVFDSK